MAFGRDNATATHAGLAYDTEVNKADVNMGKLAKTLNDRAAQGWRLHTALEQGGNLVMIFEKQLG